MPTPRRKPTPRRNRPAGGPTLLKRMENLAGRLPEVDVEHSGRHAGFLVAGKRFAWFLDDHHGDAMICMCVKVDPEGKETLIDMDPEKYLRPDYISRFGWLSIRLDDRAVDWDEVEQRLLASYRRVAPKRVLRNL